MESTDAPLIEKRYLNRPGNSVPCNFTLSRRAAILLLEFAEANPRGRGAFLSRLIIEHAHRQELREFLNVDVRKELKRIGQQVRKDLRQQTGV